MLAAAVCCVIFLLDVQFGQPLLCTSYDDITIWMFLYFCMFSCFIIPNKYKQVQDYVMVLMDKLYFICWKVWSKNKRIFSILRHLLSSWFIFRKNCANIYYFAY